MTKTRHLIEDWSGTHLRGGRQPGPSKTRYMHIRVPRIRMCKTMALIREQRDTCFNQSLLCPAHLETSKLPSLRQQVPWFAKPTLQATCREKPKQSVLPACLTLRKTIGRDQRLGPATTTRICNDDAKTKVSHRQVKRHKRT